MIFTWLFTISFFGFGFGLVAGILVLLRQQFVFTTFGMIALVLTHLLLMDLPIYKYASYFLAVGSLVGMPLIIASALSTVITIANKHAFL